MALAKAKGAKLSEAAAAIEAFQRDLKDLAGKKAAPGELFARCDAVRGTDFVRLGVRLEDRGNEGYVWMFDDRKAMELEQKEAEEKAKEAARSKIRNKLDQKQKELKAAEKSAVDPAQLFRIGAYAGMYSDF